MLDARHGDEVEAPPHGHASKLSLERYPQALSRSLADLKHAKVEFDEICLGQALCEQVQRVRALVERTLAVRTLSKGEQKMDAKEGDRPVLVYPSKTTHASKLAVPGGRERETRRFWGEEEEYSD